MVQKNKSIGENFQDLKSSFVVALTKESILATNIGALRAYYNQLLGEHVGAKWHLAEKTNLHAKNFCKAFKLSSFCIRWERLRELR